MRVAPSAPSPRARSRSSSSLCQFPGDQALAQDVRPQGVDAALQGIEGPGQNLDGISGLLVRAAQGRGPIDPPPCQGAQCGRHR